MQDTFSGRPAPEDRQKISEVLLMLLEENQRRAK